MNEIQLDFAIKNENLIKNKNPLIFHEKPFSSHIIKMYMFINNDNTIFLKN